MKFKSIVFFIFFAVFTPLEAAFQKIGVSLITHPQGEKFLFETSDENAGLILFQQKNTWTIAVDIKDKFDIASFSSSNLLSNIELIPCEFAVIKFDVKPGYFPQIGKYNKGWFVVLQTGKYSSCEDIQIEQRDQKYILKSTGIAEKISFQDPITGDEISAFPSNQIQKCTSEDHNYASFSLLKTFQGIAIRSKVDHLKIDRVSADTISIDIPNIFAPSKADKNLYEQNPESMIVEFSQKDLNNELFYEKKVDLLNKITTSSKQNAITHYLDFAKFLISFAQGSEAFDYLSSLNTEFPKIKNMPVFSVLFGLAALLSDDLIMAMTNLSKSYLKESGDAPFYLNLTRGLQKLPFKEAELNHFLKIAPRLPKDLKINLALKTMKVAIDHQLFDLARAIIPLILKEDLSPENKAMMMYYEAVVYEHDGLNTEAQRNFEELKMSIYVKPRILASIRPFMKDQNTPEKRSIAAQELEKLRFSLTHDPVEIEILEKLADLYRVNHEWIKALRSWNKIIKYYPQYAQKKELKKVMKNLFLDQYTFAFMKETLIFIVLGLFDEFSFLIQKTDDETRIVLELTELCMNTSLNQRAIKLLNTQLKKTSTPLQKMTFLLKLAQIQSRIGKDREVLKIIDQIQQDILPPQDQKKLNFLKTYTLYTLGEISLGNEDILPGDDSYEAHNFRARVYWASKNWEKAANSLKKVLSLSSSEALSTQYHVIYYAIAVRYAGNFELLKDLREFYLPQLKGSPLQEIFDFITTLDTSISGLNLNNINNIFNEIKTLEKFMEEYKKQQQK